MEYWSIGAADLNTVRAKMDSNNYASTSDHSNTPPLHHSTTPTLQHSNTPSLQHSIAPLLQYSATMRR
jgi:hypothetical protein